MNRFTKTPLWLVSTMAISLVSSFASGQTFVLQKQGSNFSIDGNHGSTQDQQQVYLWDTDLSNVNQHWIEIDRGNGFYSYQKFNTSLCLDGEAGGAREQIVKLWQCGDTNQNQHWNKISTGGNSYRLEKRNANGFSIDGDVGAERSQGIYLWNSNSNNVNQQWEFLPVGLAGGTGVTIPAIIQAEDYVDQSGVETEATRDSGGGENLSYIESGDFTEYLIRVPESGSYTLSARVASRTSGGTINVDANGENVGSLTVSGTGNWQNWTTVSSTVELDAGTQFLRLNYSGGNGVLLNVNWIELSQEQTNPGTVTINGFIHPAVAFSIADLERMKANRGVAPWSIGWNAILESEGSLDYEMQGPFVEVGNQPGINQSQHTNDSEAVLFHALQWYFTKNEAHARKAVDILDAWSTTHTTWSGRSVHLHAAWRGSNYVMGAEILRHTYPGWTEQNTINTENYFRNVIWPVLRLPDPLRAANQGANNVMGSMFVAAYLSDREMWDQAVDAYLNDPCGGITNSLANGQSGDTGRDQGHTMAQIGNLAMAAEVAWKQGLDLYGALDNRLMAMQEYFLKYNEAREAVPFIDAGTCYGYYTSVGSDGRTTTLVHAAAMVELVYGAYAIRKGIPMPYTQPLYDFGVDGNSDADILTFLHRKDNTDRSLAPVLGEPDAPISLSNVTSLISRDIGDVDIAGSSSNNGTNWTLNGSGIGIGNRYDGFQYAYKQESGDGAMQARVSSISGNGLACITIRESLDQFVDMARVCASPNDGVMSSDIGKVVADGGGSQTFPLAQLPIWIKLERRGDQIHTYVGPDGENWTAMTNLVMDIPNTYYIGLAVTSQDNTQTVTGTFTNVRGSN